MENIDIKEKMFDLLNNTKGLYSYIAIEKLVSVMMAKYLESQNKRFIQESDYNHLRFDMILPDRIDDEKRLYCC